MYESDTILGSVPANLIIILFTFCGLGFSGYQYSKVKNIQLYNADYQLENVHQKIIPIYEAISEGANAFLKQEFRYMYTFIVVFGLIIFLLIGSANNCGNTEITNVLKDTDGSCWMRGFLTSISFAIGALTSMLCGYLGMKVGVFTNARTTIGAINGWKDSFITAFQGGSVVGFTLSSVGLGILFSIIHLYHLHWDLNKLGNGQALFEAIAGFGLGGSSIALFARVGGGIFTKAADIGSDLVGKYENNIPEDSPLNPGVIADCVGDNVGDIAGMGADLFGSFAEATCAALIISSTSPDLNSHWASLIFPLLISAVGIFGGIITATIPMCKPVLNELAVEKTLKNQLVYSTLLTTPLLAFISFMFLPSKFCVELSDKLTPTTDFTWDTDNPTWCNLVSHNYYALICILCGLYSGLVIGFYTEYMTSYSYKPVKEVASVSDKGAAVNIIYGHALGHLSVTIPVIFIASTILISLKIAGMYGVSLAALGMLSTYSIGLTIDSYGPIVDNAGGVAEMAELDSGVREITDALDAAGNTTAAIGKGFAIGSACLVSLALFGAFVTRTGLSYSKIDILHPQTFFGLLLGAMIPYLFCAMTFKSTGQAAQTMITEIRRQFREIPGILEGTNKPDYYKCVEISTEASLEKMINPGLLIVLSPIFIGFIFGVNALSGYLTGNIICSIQLAISLSNSGGAWDNSKKYIEKGNFGGKNSEAHGNAVIGDTLGDLYKDVSGPSLNIVMKLMAIVSVVFSSFFVKNSLPVLIDSYSP